MKRKPAAAPARKKTGRKPPPPVAERDWFTAAEIAAEMGVEDQTVCAWVTTGVQVIRDDRVTRLHLPATKIGRYRIAKADWERFRAAMRSAGGGTEPPETAAEQRRRADQAERDFAAAVGG